MTDKLTHYKLREWCESRSPMWNMAMHYTAGDCNPGYYRSALSRMADEIERNYIPIPRFPDGEPISNGCDVEGGIVYFAYIRNDGFWMLYDEDGNELQSGCAGDSVKRPATKVLDADGVEIKSGVMAYGKSGGKRKVAKVGTEFCEGMEDWDGTPWVMFDDGTWMHAHDVTLREPDSLEKLRDDILDVAADDRSASFMDEVLHGYADRLTALIERGA